MAFHHLLWINMACITLLLEEGPFYTSPVKGWMSGASL